MDAGAAGGVLRERSEEAPALKTFVRRELVGLGGAGGFVSWYLFAGFGEYLA